MTYFQVGQSGYVVFHIFKLNILLFILSFFSATCFFYPLKMKEPENCEYTCNIAKVFHQSNGVLVIH